MFLDEILSMLFFSAAIIIGCGIVFILFKTSRFTNELYKRLNLLEDNVTNEAVEDLIIFIKTRYSPNYRYTCREFIIAAYKLINMSENVDEDYKKKFWAAALSRGILIE